MSMQPAKKNVNNIIYLNPIVTPENALKILKAVKAETDTTLKHLLAGLLDNMSEAAFEEMDTADEQDSLERHFNIMRAVKTHQKKFLETFFKLMNQGWMNLLHHKDTQAVPDASGAAEVEIERLQKKISIHYKILLAEVSGRFNTIAGQKIQQHPLLPKNIYLCFWAATEQLKLGPKERDVMVSLFNRFVMDKAGKLLGAANSKLEMLGIEPLQEKKNPPADTLDD